MLRFAFLGLLAAFIAPAVAQTFTACSPLNSTCAPDPALAMEYNWNMTNTTLDTTQGVWNVTGEGISYLNNYAEFTIDAKGQSPTIQSSFYVFWGSVSVIMKAAHGQGIVSSIVLESDDLDEIDWEWIGGNSTHVQTNYFGKGNTTTYDRAVWVPVSNPQDQTHNYTTVWNQNELQWIIDGQVVRTLPYAEADGAGQFYPQTPMQLKLGSWAGGDSASNGTVQWAGGEVDYSQAPFIMSVSNVHVNDAQRNVSSYTYSDHTGAFDSIKMATGQSSISNTLTQPPPESVTQKFNALPSGAKIGIFASVGGVVLVLLALGCCCCVRQRKAGRKERALADAEWDKSNSELLAYRNQMARGGFAASSIPLSPNPQYAAASHKF